MEAMEAFGQGHYIDGFSFPIPRIHLKAYQEIAKQVGGIWKEYGALAYFEYVGDELYLEGTRSFVNTLGAQEDEVVIIGWVVFPSKIIRDKANQEVPTDPRMADLVAPLINPEHQIFDATRMVYGGFCPLVVV